MIFFVGAGPGAPDLITMRGANLLAQADVCIYAGSLVNPELLDLCPSHCKIYNSASMTLEEVVEIMQEADREEATCIRLHTGDPSLYGAIREQIDQLKKENIPFAVCPGVSSYAAAAAALGLEYTLPEVSQSLIISRIAGRTPVPEAESLERLAQHRSSMVIFLSAGHMERVQAELLAGGYPPETPAAIVYKVSWPEEQSFPCTVGSLAETAEKASISNFALILVGEFLGKDYVRSKLYDPNFSTAFRPAKGGGKTAESGSCTGHDSCLLTSQPLLELSDKDPETENAQPQEQEKGAGPCYFTNNASRPPLTSILTFSAQGQELGEKVSAWFASHGSAVNCQNCPDGGLKDWTAKHFDNSSALIFVGASGIAVRAIAPHLYSKTTDPAVLVVDETGKFVIPLASGHLGGANQLAEELAAALGAITVVTTATDRRKLWAVDNWTRQKGYHILNPEEIKRVSQRILAGKVVKLYSDFPIEGPLPLGVVETQDLGEADMSVSWKRLSEEPVGLGPMGGVSPWAVVTGDVIQPQNNPYTLYILVPSVMVGIGARKDIPAALVSQAIEEAIDAVGCNPLALCGLASIDLKAQEAGIREAAEFWNLPYQTYSADQLKLTHGNFYHSDFVEEITGVDNVAERAAVLAAGQGELVQSRLVRDGVTVALALKKTIISF